MSELIINVFDTPFVTTVKKSSPKLLDSIDIVFELELTVKSGWLIIPAKPVATCRDVLLAVAVKVKSFKTLFFPIVTR